MVGLHRNRDIVTRIADLNTQMELLTFELHKIRDRLESLVPLFELVAAKMEEGKKPVFIDRKLLEKLDVQVKAGTYRSRSSAVEEIIRKFSKTT